MIKRYITALLRRSRPGSDLFALRLLWMPHSYLRSIGWFDSVVAGLPIDQQGQAIPWYTYSAIEFLGPRVTQAMAVFEYGSGNSTLWWRRRAGRVVSCEHDRDWHARMQLQLPDDAEYLHVELQPAGTYSRAILAYQQAFDIVVIDGRDRVECAAHCLAALRSTGVIVWDNSDRSEYTPGFDFLAREGFRRLDFVGAGPINAYAWSTSVFYRPGNCLGI